MLGQIVLGIQKTGQETLLILVVYPNKVLMKVQSKPYCVVKKHITPHYKTCKITTIVVILGSYF